MCRIRIFNLFGIQELSHTIDIYIYIHILQIHRNIPFPFLSVPPKRKLYFHLHSFYNVHFKTCKMNNITNNINLFSKTMPQESTELKKKIKGKVCLKPIYI